jgi:hypothetical protein
MLLFVPWLHPIHPLFEGLDPRGWQNGNPKPDVGGGRGGLTGGLKFFSDLGLNKQRPEEIKIAALTVTSQAHCSYLAVWDSDFMCKISLICSLAAVLVQKMFYSVVLTYVLQFHLT